MNPPAWAVGVSYVTASVASYNGLFYICLTPNTATLGGTPDVTPTLWALLAPLGGGVSEYAPAWAIGTSYVLGSVVSYSGSYYVGLASSTGTGGATPDVATTLWAVLASPPIPAPSSSRTPQTLVEYVDPCQLLSEENFNLGYPEFKGKGMLSIVGFHLQMASTLIDPRVWRDKTALGHGLLTAHMLCNSPSGKTAKMVPDNGMTTYGRLYDKLVRIVGGANRITI